LATLHANNANQTIKRILNFFPESAHKQLLMDLSLNLSAVVAQRLLPGVSGALVLAHEVMLRTAYITDLILKGAIDEIRSAITKNSEPGMQSFDQCLLDLHTKGLIDMPTALAHADSRTDLSLKLRLSSTNI
jgi:twitching motility protein PilU